MKIRFALFAITFLLISAQPVLAQGLPDDAPPLAVLRLALDLSEAQIEDIRVLAENRAEAVRPLKEQIHQLEGRLQEAVSSDLPDPGNVGELVLDSRDLRLEIGQHQAAFNTALHDLLTEDQLERIRHIRAIALATRAAKALNELGLR